MKRQFQVQKEECEYEVERGSVLYLCYVLYRECSSDDGLDDEGCPINYRGWVEVDSVEVGSWYDQDSEAGWESEMVTEECEDGKMRLRVQTVALIPPFTEEERQRFEEHVVEGNCPDD